MTTPASAKSHDRFPDTRWSLVVAASEPDSPASRRAFAELCQIYWFPIYSYIRNRGKSPEDAEDLTQEFFATLIERETLRAADAERGKLRAYLLGSVKRFIVSAHRKESAQKRGGGKKPISFDTAMAEMLFSDKPVAAGTPEEIFEQTWARSLLDRVSEQLADSYGAAGKDELFKALEPFIQPGGDEPPYFDLAERLGASAGSLRVAVFRLRQKFREVLEQEIADTLADPGDLDSEIGYLMGLFAR